MNPASYSVTAKHKLDFQISLLRFDLYKQPLSNFGEYVTQAESGSTFSTWCISCQILNMSLHHSRSKKWCVRI